jgi:arginase family enzyme
MDFPRAIDAFGASRHAASLVFIGAGYGGASISGGSFERGPAAVRDALARCTTGREGLGIEGLAIADAGDLPLEGLAPDEMQARLAEALAEMPPVPLVVCGGDNSITVGVVRGIGADALLTFDAHHDCRDPAGGITNGTPVRQLLDARDVWRVAQIGIQPFANGIEPRRYAEEHAITIVEAATVHRDGIDHALDRALVGMTGAERIVVDLDLDVLDRAHAPGAPASMPGGLEPSMTFEAMQRLGADPRVVGLDVTELDPARDVNEVTARTAALAILHFAAGVRGRSGR